MTFGGECARVVDGTTGGEGGEGWTSASTHGVLLFFVMVILCDVWGVGGVGSGWSGEWSLRWLLLVVVCLFRPCLRGLGVVRFLRGSCLFLCD